MKVKELKALLEAVNDDALVVTSYSIHPECGATYRELSVNPTYATLEMGGTMRPNYGEPRIPVVVFE